MSATPTDTAEPHRVAALGKAELDALIERVREARDRDLALGAADLSLLRDALMTLASVHERLEHDDLTITKSRKLLGLVRSSEKLVGLGALAGAAEGGTADAAPPRSRSSKSPRRRRPPSTAPRPTVRHHPITGLARRQCCPGCGRGRLYKYQPGRVLAHRRTPALQRRASCQRAAALQRLRPVRQRAIRSSSALSRLLT